MMESEVSNIPRTSAICNSLHMSLWFVRTPYVVSAAHPKTMRSKKEEGEGAENFPEPDPHEVNWVGVASLTCTLGV